MAMNLGGKQAMTFSSIAGPGVAKTALAVTISMHPAAAHHHDGSRHVTVRAGDTLSSISKREYGSAARWPALWWTNRHRVHNPSSIMVGQRLNLSGWHPVKPWITTAAMAAIPAPPPPPPAPAPAPAPQPAAPASSAPATSAPASSVPASSAQSTGSYSASSGSYENCVIQAESGGDASAVNPTSGAGGLYGFMPSTWHSLGYSGLPQDAPASVQHEAYAKEYARSGSSAWSPYDGC
jgi:resuscitation-promoting factor RpfC